MANKKAASSAKKSTPKSSNAKKQTKVTTVKAADSRPADKTVSSKRRPSVVARFNRMPLLAAAIAEFVGTFLLTAIIVTQQNQPIALLFGLVGVFMLVGGLSGAHVNPAITVGAWVTRRMNSARAVSYLFAQVLGAMLAFVVLSAFVGEAPEVSQQAAMFGQTAPQLFTAAPIPEGNEWTLLFAELIGVTVLGFAYANALQKGRDKLAGAFTVGAGVFVALVIAGTAATYVGASAILNPAAAFALEAFTELSSVWPVAIYIVVAALGGVFGFALYDLLKVAEDKKV